MYYMHYKYYIYIYILQETRVKISVFTLKLFALQCN